MDKKTQKRSIQVVKEHARGPVTDLTVRQLAKAGLRGSAEIARKYVGK